MFEQSSIPRVFGIPPGVDFARSLVTGLRDRTADASIDVLARTEIYVNTSRMQRRIREIFDTGPSTLLPRVRLITDLAHDPVSASIPPAVSPLRRRLELSTFVAKLLEQEPTLAPRAAVYDLSDSLADLMDEMQGEGVRPEAITGLDISDQSGHWDRALSFLRIIMPFVVDSAENPDKEARQRMVIEALDGRWSEAPPSHPIIIAGSTGSRGATAQFMRAVAKLPQGAIVLPGFDDALPSAVWEAMDDQMTAEDHPQFRFRQLMNLLGLQKADIKPWSGDKPVHPKRNKLISLSLRPAPVTSQWFEEGPELPDLIEATKGMALVEAASPRAEAEAIALRLREAAQQGITAALISPDRMLTRQVTAALDRWDLRPDDSAGIPLALSPPGRFLRHVANILGQQPSAEALLTLLKHPLCHSGGEDRGPHLRHSRELELYLRDKGAVFPDAGVIADWVGKGEGRETWAAWVIGLLEHAAAPNAALADHLAAHIALSEQLCAGPSREGSGSLWNEAAGREAWRICDMLNKDADAGGMMHLSDYATLFGSVLSSGTVRDRDKGHPNILIWGTLEARVQGADLTILGGMNEGIWPEPAPPDPWLNRTMRAKAGLLLPERRIGLSAHDYQQAVAGREVWITRAKRDSDAETVPSRWVNRLTNLLSGLPSKRGPEALEAMRERGQRYLEMAAVLSTPAHRSEPAQRPSPRPPQTARPDRISVTQVKTLIRDPFAIYAAKILRLKPLDPLMPTADSRLRGILVHGILERFVREGHPPDDRAAFMNIARQQLQTGCPWPTIRAQWIARLERTIDSFLAAEVARRTLAEKRILETSGKITVPGSDVVLTCKADRIDLTPDGTALIYDYKTGQVPTAAQQGSFDKQLLLEAAMVERGAFEEIGSRPVDAAIFLGVNASMKDVRAPLEKHPAGQTWDQLQKLMQAWQTRGYTARLALFLRADFSPYDHLSRYGEWDTSDIPAPEDLT